MGIKWIRLISFVILSQYYATTALDGGEDNLDINSADRAQVEVRSVFINCEPEGSVAPDSDTVRFEREELFKHSILHDCNKKLAVTVKIISEPDSSGDEYLPIEHVFEGSNKKRIRLLDPYILRLRREPPLQAYKLRRVDTISGVLVDKEGHTYTGTLRHLRSRIERDIQHSEKTDDWRSAHKVHHVRSYPVKTEATELLSPTTVLFTESETPQSKSCVEKRFNDMCARSLNLTLNKRKKRNEHNIVVEEATDYNKQWNANDRYYRLSDPERESVLHSEMYEDIRHKSANNANHKKETIRISVTKPQPSDRQKKLFRPKTFYLNEASTSGKNQLQEKVKTNAPSLKTKEQKSHSSVTSKRFENDDYNSQETDETERDYAVYEIGNPELWYTVHVQLFEKLSTPDGKTVWNDLTKGEQASVSSKAPEWTGQDLTVRYRPAEWIPREEFSLPTSSLCLLAPIKSADSASYNENSTFGNDGGYVVVPEEDVMGLKDDDNNINKREDNISESEFGSKFDESNEQQQGRRKVIVRTSRALLGGNEEKVNIAYHGNDKYLTLPHKRPHHAQIDLEARADENELVRVGASGRIAIAVADSTRRTRTIMTLQVGNTGLAAARFRVLARDCGPALAGVVNDKNKQVTMAGPVLIPPRHTRSLKLELPIELPVDVAQCSVSLVNDDDKSIAVREVSIRKGDRCFCVWHCDCVCLGEDPKLICREMAESRQSAAGLSSRDRTRHARSACYQDVVSLNIFVIFTGVIMALLFLGCMKAFLGLVFKCIGTWGLDMMVQMPRKLDHYYESCLRNRKVEYDCFGYPIHPDTKERTVRVISRSMEFILNVIFFVSVPCIIVCDAIKQLISRCTTQRPQGIKLSNCDTKKCFSSQDMQGVALRWRRRRGGLRRWMTPEAQELSKELWKEGLTPVKCEFMRPLLRENNRRDRPPADLREHDRDMSPAVDSEQDDTEYVLSQMQKSRESLAILKQKSKS